jgi:hypothetical protein
MTPIAILLISLLGGCVASGTNFTPWTSQGAACKQQCSLAEARKACAGKSVHADACAWTGNGACHLVIPSNGPVRNHAAYRRHEMAHCNGWEHSHAIAGRQEIEPH